MTITKLVDFIAWKLRFVIQQQCRHGKLCKMNGVWPKQVCMGNGSVYISFHPWVLYVPVRRPPKLGRMNEALRSLVADRFQLNANHPSYQKFTFNWKIRNAPQTTRAHVGNRESERKLPRFWANRMVQLAKRAMLSRRAHKKCCSLYGVLYASHSTC